MNAEELAELGKRNEAWDAKRNIYTLAVYNSRNERLAYKNVVMTVIGTKRTLKKFLTETPFGVTASAYNYGTDFLVPCNPKFTVSLNT